MSDGIDITRPKVAREQLIAAEHVKGQKTVVPVIAVEEAALLFPVNRVVGGIKIQDDSLRRRSVGGNELLDKYLV